MLIDSKMVNKRNMIHIRSLSKIVYSQLIWISVTMNLDKQAKIIHTFNKL